MLVYNSHQLVPKLNSDKLCWEDSPLDPLSLFFPSPQVSFSPVRYILASTVDF